MALARRVTRPPNASQWGASSQAFRGELGSAPPAVSGHAPPAQLVPLQPRPRLLAQPPLASVSAEEFFNPSPPPSLTPRRRRSPRFDCEAARAEVTMLEPRDSNSRKRGWAGAGRSSCRRRAEGPYGAVSQGAHGPVCSPRPGPRAGSGSREALRCPGLTEAA